MEKRYGNVFDCEMSDLIGRTFTRVEASHAALLLECDEGVFNFCHIQDCCETVEIESIIGNLNDLIGHPILLAEEAKSVTNPEGVAVPEYQDSFTWTFYKLATIKGYVDVRWYGESNGAYSESVDLIFTEKSA